MHNVLKIKMVNFQIIKNTMENIPCDEGKGGSQFDSARENGEDGNQPKSDHEEDGGGDIDIDVDDRGGGNVTRREERVSLPVKGFVATSVQESLN